MDIYMDANLGGGLMPRLDLIDSKINVIGQMISGLKANEKVLHRIGGVTITNRGEEVAFQQDRVNHLTWAKSATDGEIQTKIDELEASLTTDELTCKYGDVRGLPFETIKTISHIELLEIAIGTHPGVND
jgi:hypothetical protein